MSKRNVAREASEDQAKAIERSNRKTVVARKRRGPDGLVVANVNRASFDCRERLENIGESRTGKNALDRDSRVPPAQSREDRIFDGVDRSVVDMTALAFDDAIGAPAAEHVGHAEPAAGTDNTDNALPRQGYVRSADMAKMFRTDTQDGVTDRAEIVD